MYNIYALRSKKDNKFYIGSTGDIKKRVKYHNAGKVRSTKSRRPLVVVYKEECDSITIARKRENFLKSGQGRKWLKELLKEEAEEWQSWSIAAVLKTVVPQGTVGSNPTSSAIKKEESKDSSFFMAKQRNSVSLLGYSLGKEF